MRAIAILDLVRRLLTLEAAESQEQESVIGAAERVSDKLRAHLSNRIGQEGFRTLLARALTLATVQFPHLKVVRVGADGSLAGLRVTAGPDSPETGARVAQQETVEGAVALLGHLLALLFTFIGEDLTLRILGTVSPRLALTEQAGGDATGRGNDRP